MMNVKNILLSLILRCPVKILLSEFWKLFKSKEETQKLLIFQIVFIMKKKKISGQFLCPKKR